MGPRGHCGEWSSMEKQSEHTLLLSYICIHINCVHLHPVQSRRKARAHSRLKQVKLLTRNLSLFEIWPSEFNSLALKPKDLFRRFDGSVEYDLPKAVACLVKAGGRGRNINEQSHLRASIQYAGVFFILIVLCFATSSASYSLRVLQCFVTNLQPLMSESEWVWPVHLCNNHLNQLNC